MMKKKKALIVLEDGRVFEGESFGAAGITTGELVFNTSMTGYQEIITDPSYMGQIVTMTYPLIGNYGVNEEDVESSGPMVQGFVVKECSAITSNWRAKESLDSYLERNNIVGVHHVDTRAITRHIREGGAKRACMSTSDLDPKRLQRKALESPELDGLDLVREVTIKKPRLWNKKGKYNVAVMDCGVKYNIMRELAARGCRVTIFPATSSAEEILEIKPDGLLLSNGPADPAPLTYVHETVRSLIDRIPIFGICLGHQNLGIALGGKTYKLKFGHRGANHPVKDLETGKVHITVQNHGFCVDLESLNNSDIEPTHINLNDGTVEGLRHKKLPVFSVQYHPEASAGPNDTKYLFDTFIENIEKQNAKKKRH